MATQTQYYNLDKPSYDEVADIEVINANFDKIDQQMRNNADGVNFAKAISSDAYDNSKLYAVGDYCIYENKLYRCITAIESAEAFNIAKWEQTTVGKEVKQLNSNLVGLKVGENCGSKNYWNLGDTTATSTGYAFENKQLNLPSGTYTFSAYSDMAYELLLYDSSGNKLLSIANTEINKRWSKTFTISSNVVSASLYVHAGTVKDIQIEKGETATPYEPYIPSVKMIAEEVKQQNESLGGLSFSVSGTTLSITDGTNTWTLPN